MKKFKEFITEERKIGSVKHNGKTIDIFSSKNMGGHYVKMELPSSNGKKMPIRVSELADELERKINLEIEKKGG